MKAIIVDDEQHGIISLRKILELYCPQVDIIGEADNALDGEKLVRSLKPECIFLDIAMPGKSGLDLLKDLSPAPGGVIFVTAHHEFILQALRLSAIDYLLKPINEEELVQAVDRLEHNLHINRPPQRLDAFLENMRATNLQDMKICIPEMDGFQIRRVGNILYCEGERSYTKIVLVEGEVILVSKPLITYELLLRDLGFIRVHKSFLVNLNHVHSFHKSDGGYLIMANGHQINVSKRKKDHIIDSLKNLFRN